VEALALGSGCRAGALARHDGAERRVSRQKAIRYMVWR